MPSVLDEGVPLIGKLRGMLIYDVKWKPPPPYHLQ